MSLNTNNKPLFQYPWRYKEGFVIALILMLAGFVAEVVTPGGLRVPQWPVNLIIGVVFINLLTIIYITGYRHPVVRWLASAPAAIPAVALVTFMTFLMGFIPQESDKMPEWTTQLGLTHVTRSYAFALAQIFFLTVLGLASLKRTSPLTGKNIGFLLNHVGLWIVIAAASLGSGDLKRMTMQLREGGEFTNRAVRNGQHYKLKVAMKLHDFKMDVYNPKLVVLNNNTFNIVRGEGLKMPMVNKGLETTLLDWKVKVEEFYDMAAPSDSVTYQQTKMMGAAPAALIKAVNNKTGAEKSGWITGGSFMLQPDVLKLNNKLSLVLTKPEPKKYASVVEYVTKDGKRDTATIEVNDPLKIQGWKVYQLNYNSSRGRWSKTSVLEFINDPWLPVVYVGIFMMMAGAVYVFWLGRRA